MKKNKNGCENLFEKELLRIESG